jgi:hypothetical protein
LADDGIGEVEAFYGVGEVAHKVGPPEFAVGKDVEPKFLLALKNVEDVSIFDRLELRGGLLRTAGVE